MLLQEHRCLPRPAAGQRERAFSNEETYLFICFFSLSLPCRQRQPPPPPLPEGGSCLQNTLEVEQQSGTQIFFHVSRLSAVKSPEYARNKDSGDAEAAADGSVTWTARTKIDDHLRRLTSERRLAADAAGVAARNCERDWLRLLKRLLSQS